MTANRIYGFLGLLFGTALFGCGVLRQDRPHPTITNPLTSTLKITETRILPPSTKRIDPTTPPTMETPSATATQDPIIYFTGDLVSADSKNRAQKVVALIEELIAQHSGSKILVASTGDNEQEDHPTLSDYQLFFGSTYGVFLAQGIFRPVRGNHDIQDDGHGLAYASYFESVFPAKKIHITGGKMYFNYSYDLGAWHFIGLDQYYDTINQSALDFLRADLGSRSTSLCQLVYWHVPTYSSGVGHGDASGLMELNQMEYAAGVDIQINGHDHDYQRFFPMDPTGKRDDAKGVTTFIDGIGGEDDRKGAGHSVAQAASALYLDAFPGGNGNHAIGVIQFVLHALSADFTLYNANDGTVLDSGEIHCH